jgi:hypothetical protein
MSEYILSSYINKMEKFTVDSFHAAIIIGIQRLRVA